MTFDLSELAIDHFLPLLDERSPECIDGINPDHRRVVRMSARATLSRIARSDALYHDLAHTMSVVLAGLDILRGKQILDGGVTSSDWMHMCVALLCHDVGYVRGICRQDRPPEYIVSQSGDTVSLSPGASDAALTPYHVDRGKIFAREYLATFPDLELDRITAAIEATRFPCVDKALTKNPEREPSLVQAADLIGQFGDPNYLRKANALFHEFVEARIAEEKGYTSAVDLTTRYPTFYWKMIRPSLSAALDYLAQTARGRTWIAGLSMHVHIEEHREPRSGPQR
ncbi:hypothetical protein [Thalassobaculum litoreum]|uniref:HD/PDEase domain-containing protein n=1 Tax=Thalassobaculum litoreum DSM 18839 TaxID=1123362 RepID=A0A8G2EYK1_9PROT|nr:hypothetical protein [Thalassobaculum litoreum]SDG59344.1 hypothetical protein SAMN05660686_04962 [Thalassobaculum litoreum DSM 18839]